MLFSNHFRCHAVQLSNSAVVSRVLVSYWQFKNSGLPLALPLNKHRLNVTAAVMETDNGTIIITFTGF